MNTFSTIITADHYPKAYTLYKSLARFNSSIQLQVLLADDGAILNSAVKPEGIKVFTVNYLKDYPLVKELYDKYALSSMDFFRWSMKPVFVSYLLEDGFDKVIYLDCDMFFFNEYDFLFLELDQSSVLLTPNWINSDPSLDKDSYISLFTSGFFSAGFVGANRNGLAALKWWAEACLFMMGADIKSGIRDDQKYLDILPAKFEEINIIRHRGCNIGAWNYRECKRTLINGKVLINGEFPVIFIHFDGMLVQGILRRYDKLLKPYLEEYKKLFKESGYDLSGFIKEIDLHEKAGIITRLKWKLSFRTRMKNFLYKLSFRL